MSRGRSLPKFLSEKEREKVFSMFDEERYSSHRWRMLLKLMLDTGLRTSEALNLRPEHVDLEEGRLVVRDGKGSKDRTLWFGEATRQDLIEWAERRPEDSPWLFPTQKGTRTAGSSFRRAVKRAVRRSGIPEAEKVSPHTFRHTFATDMLQNTGSIEVVRQALGHESIETTLIYTHLVNDEVENAMKELRS